MEKNHKLCQTQIEARKKMLDEKYGTNKPGILKV